ncbi:hypothetical protein CYMTET_26320 [Cymbomonas tetramitiformis]|uniref:Uncharacterized protein n=1 Tax=Cymbomonas tetramitiformis TaxID=36881 RepID=A0AAE0FSR8_9CHLO|nr:hypothetical protein CYMTET_26320 [Cymbomonas tetramitiformis]
MLDPLRLKAGARPDGPTFPPSTTASRRMSSKRTPCKHFVPIIWHATSVSRLRRTPAAFSRKWKNAAGGGGVGGGEGYGGGNGGGGWRPPRDDGDDNPWKAVGLCLAVSLALVSNLAKNHATSTSGQQSSSLPILAWLANNAKSQEGAQKDSRVGSDGAAVQRFELDAVKRLLREIFADFVVMRGRLDTIESITGVRTNSNAAGASSLGGSRGTPASPAKGFGQSSGVRWSGRIGYGLTTVPPDADDQEEVDWASSFPMRSGAEVLMSLEVPFRTRDTLSIHCTSFEGEMPHSMPGADREAALLPAAVPLAIHKIIYRWYVHKALKLRAVPVGATGDDIGLTLNPMHGAALSHFASRGSAIYNACGGAAAFVAEAGSESASISIGHFAAGPAAVQVGGGGSNMAQVTIRPTPWWAAAVTLMHRSASAYVDVGSEEGDSVDESTSTHVIGVSGVAAVGDLCTLAGVVPALYCLSRPSCR